MSSITIYYEDNDPQTFILDDRPINIADDKRVVSIEYNP